VPRRRLPAAGEALTPRESAVLRLLPTTMSLREIADTLFVSRDTVKTQCRTLYRKLSASSREEAVRSAREAGLL
jgi:DNA-binding CsgD family transcriptional regulator